MKVAILFENLGPYHLARLNDAAQACTLLAWQVNSRSSDYSWQPSAGPGEFSCLTLSNERSGSGGSVVGQVRRLWSSLAKFKPDCLFLPGWSAWYSVASFAWCRARKIPMVMMSESTEHDFERVAWKEALKCNLVRRCSAALVGGALHAEYVAKLGMPRERIFKGYDVVDNGHFARGAEVASERAVEYRHKYALPGRYLLASGRFIERKNLPALLTAFAGYRRAVCDAPRFERWAWSLVLLGDGPLRATVRQTISKLQLDGAVVLPGFKQYPELPIYYGLADAFVHTATSEPWGLVVNEAMASSLPVLVSNRCGCVVELVREGVNGFTFDPQNTRQLTEQMLKTWRLQPQLPLLGKASSDIISRWDPGRFVKGFCAAAAMAAGNAVGRDSNQAQAWPPARPSKGTRDEKQSDQGSAAAASHLGH